MLYLQKLMDAIMILCAVLVLGTFVYVKTTEQEIVFVATTEDLSDYKVAYEDCLSQNEVFRHLELVMESEMALCLEDRGH